MSNSWLYKEEWIEQKRILFTVVLSISRTSMAGISFVPGLQTRNTIILEGGQKEGRGVSGVSSQVHIFNIGPPQYGQLAAVKTG